MFLWLELSPELQCHVMWVCYVSSKWSFMLITVTSTDYKILNLMVYVTAIFENEASLFWKTVKMFHWGNVNVSSYHNH